VDLGPPPPDTQKLWNDRMFGAQLGASGFISPGRLGVTDGPSIDLDVVYKKALGQHSRFELGLAFRTVRTDDADHYAIGVPLRFAFGVGRHFEMILGATPGYAHIDFAAPYFQSSNAFLMRAEYGLNFPITSFFALGFSPLAISMMGSSAVPLIVAYEPKVWAGFAFP
jgi:hypothetical protein